MPIDATGSGGNGIGLRRTMSRRVRSVSSPAASQVAALYLLINNLIGLGLGPTLMPLVSDYLLDDPAKVYQAIAIVTAGCGALAAVLYAWICPRYARLVKEAAAWN